MDHKSYERMRAILESRNIPKWVWGIVLIVIIALVVLGALITANQNSVTTTGLPGTNIVSTTGLFFNITLKLGIVLLLVYVFMQLLKRWQGAKQGKQKKYLSVVETAYLNPRQALHLVKAGDKLLLVGSTDQSVSCLSELAPDILTQDSAVSLEESTPGSLNTINNFAALLAQSINKR